MSRKARCVAASAFRSRSSRLSSLTTDALAQPFVSFAGISTSADLPAADLAAFNTFYGRTHIPEILRDNPGFVGAERFELHWSDPRGVPGPRWLTMYGVEDESAA